MITDRGAAYIRSMHLSSEVPLERVCQKWRARYPESAFTLQEAQDYIVDLQRLRKEMGANAANAQAFKNLSTPKLTIEPTPAAKSPNRWRKKESRARPNP